MPTTRCRECREPVTPAVPECPHCGAPRPERTEFLGEGYEWKSRGTWMGEPLVHIAFGMDRSGRPRTARGVVAIGQRASGVIAVGIVAFGFVAIGAIALGMFSFGVVAVALLAACGVNAFAPLALGVVAIGFAAGGVQAIGWRILFSIALEGCQTWMGLHSYAGPGMGERIAHEAMHLLHELAGSPR